MTPDPACWDRFPVAPVTCADGRSAAARRIGNGSFELTSLNEEAQQIGGRTFGEARAERLWAG